LTVILKSPANQARVTDPATVVGALVNAGRGVAQVTVTLNGVEVHRQAESAATRSLAVSKPVTLAEGTNVIVVTARDVDGQVRQEMATVVYARPTAAAAVPVPLQAAPPAVVIESMRTEKRVALVIGNGAYQHTSPLRNPVNDARAMAATLRALGFEVLARENAGQKDMKRAVDDFGDRLRGGGVGIFYYAGHGLQVEGRNYLVPTDAQIRNEREVELEGIDVARVLARMEQARNRLNIVVLDACRDNPFARSFRSSSRGLAAIDAPSGTLIAYATSPGRLARDGEGANGLYTGELLLAMRQPELRLEDVFKRVRQAVRVKTSGDQIPWEASSVEGDFYFALPLTGTKR
jgi:hypothetical protein